MDITQTKFLCDISLAVEHAVSNVILFDYREEDTGFVSHSVVMPRKKWNALGCPHQVTVTIVPGDQMMED